MTVVCPINFFIGKLGAITEYIDIYPEYSTVDYKAFLLVYEEHYIVFNHLL